MKSITLAWLIRQEACDEQVAIFKRVFGVAAEVNAANALLAVEAGMDINWLADHLLSAPAWAEYKRVCAPAREEYERVRATAWEEYERHRCKT